MNRRMTAMLRHTGTALPKLGLILMVALACFAASSTVYASPDKPAKKPSKSGKLAKYGRVQITTPTGSYPVLLDGNPSGATAPVPCDPNTDEDCDPTTRMSPPRMTLDELSPQRHRVEVLMPDGSRWTKDIDVAAGRYYCVGVTYKTVAKHCWDYPLTANITPSDRNGDLITFKSDVNYGGPSAVNYIWTVSPATAKIVSGGTGSPDVTISTAGVSGPLKVTLVADADDGSGDARCRQAANAEMQLETCTSTPITANITSQPYFARGQNITFTANTQYAGTKALRYNWTVSPESAKISSGQGTPSISVDTSGLGSNQHVTASLMIDDGSNDPNCQASTEATSDTCYDCFDYVKMNDLKARLDNFGIELQNTPGATGQIYVHGPLRQAQSVGKSALNYLVNSRQLGADRINVEPITDSDKIHIELYVVKIGAARPTPNLNSVTGLPQPQGIQHIPTHTRRPRRR